MNELTPDDVVLSSARPTGKPAFVYLVSGTGIVAAFYFGRELLLPLDYDKVALRGLALAHPPQQRPAGPVLPLRHLPHLQRGSGANESRDRLR